tara:strand:+ start:191 stop:496 length:306 start_codon:yes stop_codon:yes gene_type:complete
MSRRSTHDNRMEMELQMFSALCSLVYQIDQGFNPDGETVDAARQAINGWDDYWNDKPDDREVLSKEDSLIAVREARRHLHAVDSNPVTITQVHWDESTRRT